MRRAPIPHTACGSARVCSRRDGWLRLVHALVLLATAAVALTLARAAVDGAGPKRLRRHSRATRSSFPKKQGGIFGPTPKIDSAQPLYLQADQLLYDTKNNRVIAQGNVEIYYNNYILTADQVVYDQAVNKLIAEGNAQLKDPNGGITRADRFEALDDFRDAFIQSLSVVTADDTRIAAERATRREGNTTEYERGKFTPCKNDPGMPPLWCIGAARIIHDQRAATITYQDAQFELFGVPVLYLPYFQHPDPSVKHRSGFLMPSYSNSSDARFRHRDALLFRPGAQLRLHLPSPVLVQLRHPLAGRLAPSAGQRPIHRVDRRHRPGPRRDRGRPTSRSRAGAARSRPRGNSRSRPGGGSDGTSRSRATRASAASTSSIRSCRPTASTRSICRA